MKALDIQKVVQYVEENIGYFHQKRIQSLDKLKLSQVLKRKNPYLLYIYKGEGYLFKSSPSLHL